jgi:hypothetical protein
VEGGIPATVEVQVSECTCKNGRPGAAVYVTWDDIVVLVEAETNLYSAADMVKNSHPRVSEAYLSVIPGIQRLREYVTAAMPPQRRRKAKVRP